MLIEMDKAERNEIINMYNQRWLVRSLQLPMQLKVLNIQAVML